MLQCNEHRGHVIGRAPAFCDIQQVRGSEKGQKVDAKRVISCVSDCVCPYIDGKWDEVLALARSEDLETVVSNTTEIGRASCRERE